MHFIDGQLSENHFGHKLYGIYQDSAFFPFWYYVIPRDFSLTTNFKGIRFTNVSPGSNNTNDEKQRILIVEDDPDIANLYKLILENDGFSVDSFNDPSLALSNYKAGAYDLLLLDIKMPKMSGFELYRKLRLVDDKIKVCFITAFEEYRNEFNKLFPNSKVEGDCFIRKPVGLRELTEKVKTQLQRN